MGLSTHVLDTMHGCPAAGMAVALFATQGDQATLLKSLVRDVDFAARMGGEEFLLVLSRTDTAGARQMLQRLRLAMAQQEWAQCPGLRLTLSLGMSAYRPEEDWQDCLQRADDALYRAKHAGRDQLVEL